MMYIGNTGDVRSSCKSFSRGLRSGEAASRPWERLTTNL